MYIYIHTLIPVELRKHDKKEKRSASWYTECGLFKNQEKRPNTYWYEEVGLYPSQTSTPNTSSAENSGTNTTTTILQPEIETVPEDSKENYYNLQDENIYYNQSIKSIEDVTWEMQLRLQDEPLYQFYDAAVLEVSLFLFKTKKSKRHNVNYTRVENLLTF